MQATPDDEVWSYVCVRVCVCVYEWVKMKNQRINIDI